MSLQNVEEGGSVEQALQRAVQETGVARIVQTRANIDTGRPGRLDGYVMEDLARGGCALLSFWRLCRQH